MKDPTRYRMKFLIERLKEMAFFYTCIPNKPGALINKLSKEQRDLLKKAKSSDFYNRLFG